MRRNSKAREQIEWTEVPLAMTAAAKNRLLALLETERDVTRRWMLEQAVADLDQAQRFWICVTNYPYGRAV